MITLATSSVVVYTLTISVLFLTVLILALLTVLKIKLPVQTSLFAERELFVKDPLMLEVIFLACRF